MNNTRNNPEYLPDEKKVWRGVSMVPYFPTKESGLDMNGIYFMALEELQGAWVGDGRDKYWEEAEGGTIEWEEPTSAEMREDHPGIGEYVTRTQEVLRARRYVLKQFLPSGKVKNYHDSAYSGPRQYPQN